MMTELRISKRKKTLEVWQAKQCLQRFPVGIGKNPVGHKQRRDDQRTPEGDYRVLVKNPKSQFYRSLGLSYPNPTDAWRAFRAGIINAETCQQICSAHAHGQSIPWHTAIGGAIYIHGELEKQAWSQGCIRLFNRDMKTLFSLVKIGDRVNITA